MLFSNGGNKDNSFIHSLQQWKYIDYKIEQSNFKTTLFEMHFYNMHNFHFSDNV